MLTVLTSALALLGIKTHFWNLSFLGRLDFVYNDQRFGVLVARNYKSSEPHTVKRNRRGTDRIGFLCLCLLSISVQVRFLQLESSSMRPLASGALPLLFFSAAAAQILSLPNPLICEDTIDGSPPFQSIDIPCIVGCDCQIDVATLSFLPGSINTTCYPYCNLDCVRKDATPAQSALAPSCWDRCQGQNATPENLGWCMYWCVDGYTDVVTSTTCVPSLARGAPTITVIDSESLTVDPFTNPPAWQSWYQTQTVIPRTSTPFTTSSPTPSPAAPLPGPTSSSTILSSTSAIQTSSGVPSAATPEADSTAANSMANSVSHTDPLLLAALSFLTYLAARIA
ncbi:hypothetical protein K438DRAFT_1800183 [Mycena galopus ATCC 62051]|nr:hypothetical protein K438DRAFT_1800183 [Mycena galopus ATCC 62051]